MFEPARLGEGAPLVRLVEACDCGEVMVHKGTAKLPYFELREGVLAEVREGLLVELHACAKCGQNQLRCAAKE